MQRIKGLGFILALVLAPFPAMAQGWIEYTNQADRFLINFPGEPTIEETTYQPLEGDAVPARIYRRDAGDNQYILTVVDFTTTYDFTTWPFAYTGANAVQGATAFAANAFRARGEVTYDAYDRLNLIPGHLLQVTEPDGRRLFVGIYTYDRRLYIMEASVPMGAAPPNIFRTSLAVLDSEGTIIRFNLDGTFDTGKPPVELQNATTEAAQ
jgi:hypothetical protein